MCRSDADMYIGRKKLAILWLNLKRIKKIHFGCGLNLGTGMYCIVHIIAEHTSGKNASIVEGGNHLCD